MNDATGENMGGQSPSNVPDSLIVFHHSELSKIEAEEKAAKDVVKKIAAKKKKYRKTIQADGLKLMNFDRAREMLLAEDDEEVRANLAEQGAILRAFNHPMGFQFDLFQEPDRAALEDRWKFDGFRAGSNGIGTDENPHRAGDDGHKHWLAGWNDAQKCIVAGMEMSKSTPEPEPEPEAADQHDQEESDDAEPLEADGDWREERDAVAAADDEEDPVPDDEDTALKGVEA